MFENINAKLKMVVHDTSKLSSDKGLQVFKDVLS